MRAMLTVLCYLTSHICVSKMENILIRHTSSRLISQVVAQVVIQNIKEEKKEKKRKKATLPESNTRYISRVKVHQKYTTHVLF